MTELCDMQVGEGNAQIARAIAFTVSKREYEFLLKSKAQEEPVA